MKILLKENQIIKLLEFVANKDSFPAFIREQLRLMYEPLNKYGQIQNPEQNCETGFGVYGVFPHSENDSWSILNRFDTNSEVKKGLEKIYTEQTGETTIQDNDFRNWIVQNRDDLFGENGKYTQSLVDLNIDTIRRGDENETYAVKKLQEKFPNTRIIRFCAGDIRDVKKGIDLSIEGNGRNYTVQVKPYKTVSSLIEPDGETYIQVQSSVDTTRYSSRNVDIFMFVSPSEDKFILFPNKKGSINQTKFGTARFYEEPLYTNITFPKSRKTPEKKGEGDAGKFFRGDDENAVLQSLYYKKEQIEKLIDTQLKLIKRNEKRKAKLAKQQSNSNI